MLDVVLCLVGASLSLVVVVAFSAVLSAVAFVRTCFTAYFAIFLVQRYVF